MRQTRRVRKNMVKKYRCGFADCDKRFVHLRDVYRHQRTKHGECLARKRGRVPEYVYMVNDADDNSEHYAYPEHAMGPFVAPFEQSYESQEGYYYENASVDPQSVTSEYCEDYEQNIYGHQGVVPDISHVKSECLNEEEMLPIQNIKTESCECTEPEESLNEGKIKCENDETLNKEKSHKQSGKK